MRKSHYLSMLALVSAMTVVGAANAQKAGEVPAVRTAEAQADEATAQAEEAKAEAESAQSAAQARTGDARAAHEASIDAQAAAQDAQQAAAKAQGAEAEAKGGSSATAAAIEAGQAASEATNAQLAAEAANVSAHQAAQPAPPAEPRTMADYDPMPSPGVTPTPPAGAKLLPQATASTGAPVWVTSSHGNPAPNAHGVDFPGLDANHDGWLTKAEVNANADLTREFATVDIDRNGRLDRDEVNDW